VHTKVVLTELSSACDGHELFVIVQSLSKDGKKQMVLFIFPVYARVVVCKPYRVSQGESFSRPRWYLSKTVSHVKTVN